MPWFKVDDTLAMHEKVVAAGNGAMGLWVRAGAWSMQQLTDGFIPLHMARMLGSKSEIGRLVTAGLWVEADGGYQFHAWHPRQPQAADVKRAAEAKGNAGAQGNHLRWHKRRGVVDPDCKWCQGENQ